MFFPEASTERAATSITPAASYYLQLNHPSHIHTKRGGNSKRFEQLGSGGRTMNDLSLWFSSVHENINIDVTIK